MRILIVEDDEILADSLVRTMISVGYATDGEPARHGVPGAHRATAP